MNNSTSIDNNLIDTQEQKIEVLDDTTSNITIFTSDSNQEKTIDILALESILKYLVSDMTTIKITRKVDEMGVLLILQVAQDDMGIVIGRGGEMANSIKKYVKKVGQIHNMNIRLKIDEPEGSQPRVKETIVDNVDQPFKSHNRAQKVPSQTNDHTSFDLN